MLKKGFLGAGRIGQVYGATLTQMTTPRAAAVSDFLPDAAHALAGKLGAKAMRTEEIIAEKRIDSDVNGA